jgi:hypothetical protein
MIPFLIPCRSSPAPVMVTSMKKSTMERTVTSLWPTPTVSTSNTSNPAASQRSMVSLLLRATPPSTPPEGEGRMKALAWRESDSMRVLSPRMLPPVTLLLGSTARTATRWPRSQSRVPNASIRVLLPAPGTPVTPIRMASRQRGKRRRSSSWALSRWRSALLSTRVMAWASNTRLPARTPSSYSSMEGSLRFTTAPCRGAVGGRFDMPSWRL